MLGRLPPLRGIEAITIKYRHPIPILDDLIDELHGAHRPKQIAHRLPHKKNHNNSPSQGKFNPRTQPAKHVRKRTNKTSVTSRREKVPLKGLENVKLLATLDILNPRPQEGLNEIFSSKFNEGILMISRLGILKRKPKVF
ncbi:hypothetical protein M9H77_07601 [Catharanthus roseus]|uniref:Uncharacterized protein n=1 Tax=Catharanthus roseus TaxID=4058 RepID=A0ACC0BVE9_CATRO|nr:hypothetical protein M9H77_07601 [Catharanthus roseus]